MRILKRTCILFPVGPTKNLGYQILVDRTLTLLASQFGHVFVFKGSITSEVKDMDNVTSVPLGNLTNPIDKNGKEFFSLDTAFLQQEFSTNYIKNFNFDFVIQVHCNQYFTKNQLLLLKFYLLYMKLFHRPWGWIGKRYQVMTFKSKKIKKLPWIINLKLQKNVIYQPDQIKFNNKIISAKYIYNPLKSITTTWVPSLTDILFEYNYYDMRERFHYYYNRMGRHDNVEVFIEGIFSKFSKFKFKNYEINSSEVSQFLDCYSNDSLANSFVKEFLEYE